MPSIFPYLPVASSSSNSFLVPLLPIELRVVGGDLMRAHGLLDSGAAVNVMPYALGLRLGAVWERQTVRVALTGNLAAQEARVLMVDAIVKGFEPVRLAFAWSRMEQVPLLLGQMNFFREFDICFHRRRQQFEINIAQQ